MIYTLISVVLYLVVAGVIWWAINKILGVIPLPEPIRTVIYVIMVVILVLICIYALTDLLHVAVPRLR